ncbi:hypothetical protein BL250_13870 [Erwinia sp. OLTSP20]|uniref:helix-turn-helix domain-containing protein n=1 Tax=unclassified Erwinia TaxID=2622719 RepID=UPI000C1A8047|nr:MULTISPECIES: helix-turn-helix transcriptional regulator [unclassified Erwinia]PIJ50356.1 hypothetical protein BV501_09770 [Erwinia sp. OAMSP11]PIJ72191.1 hypothetical protein BK416_10660 [Erwinia sp. OLSSP12]PIJ81482.1 hypothetical protein BLD47_09485 [Erwinia sp. OLCASP19]PIJ84188.1 hypothetical protein BLD46_09065 [Erwinia sp. OLMTSP26]PIJ85887.1 hypothetical protein BLD49_10285 [Erwinia sp. OLMDSP33]
MKFSAQLTQLRKAAGLTQQELANSVAIHVNQLRRYEAGTAQPTLTPLIKLASRLNVSLDELVFANAKYPPSQELLAQFIAVKVLAPRDRRLVVALLNAVISHNQGNWPQHETDDIAGVCEE